MSKESIELIRSGIVAFNQRDVEGMLETLHADVELEPLRAVLEGRVYHGHDGLREWLEDMSEDWEDFGVELADVREVGQDRVLVEATVHARARMSGVVVDVPGAWLCELRDSRVARIRFYKDAESALREAG